MPNPGVVAIGCPPEVYETISNITEPSFCEIYVEPVIDENLKPLEPIVCFPVFSDQPNPVIPQEVQTGSIPPETAAIFGGQQNVDALMEQGLVDLCGTDTCTETPVRPVLPEICPQTFVQSYIPSPFMRTPTDVPPGVRFSQTFQTSPSPGPLTMYPPIVRPVDPVRPTFPTVDKCGNVILDPVPPGKPPVPKLPEEDPDPPTFPPDPLVLPPTEPPVDPCTNVEECTPLFELGSTGGDFDWVLNPLPEYHCVGAGGPSNWLYIKPGFTIPVDATVMGFEVELHRVADAPFLIDEYARLVKSGNQVGNEDRAITNPPWEGGGGEIVNYGGPTDLWDGINPADVNDPDFGFAYMVNNVVTEGVDTSVNGSITYACLRIYYCLDE